MTALNATHDPKLRSWVESAHVAGTDFPIQNLPFGRFRPAGTDEAFRIGVAIGDQVLDLKAAKVIDHADMNRLMAATPAERVALRTALSEGLQQGSPKQGEWELALYAQSAVEMALPCHIGDYTDFYTGIHHATTVGKLFRPDQPLMPNYKWVPIGYHGRASSIAVSGQQFKRPQGQTKAPDAAEPSFGPSKRLDYELELGFLIGQGNALGEPIAIGEAEQHLFGVTLLNDWSARDLQAWEYQPLGPFLAKNFASTLSPWIVTMEALAPFRAKFERPAGDPQPMAYLDSQANREGGALDVTLEVWLHTAKMRAAGEPATRLTRGNTTQAAYWTAAQLVTHHTVNGCNLQPGDLLGSGTLSGPTLEEAGSLLELTFGGKQPLTLPNGERRTFLEDGDTLTLRGYCERAGAVRIGLGEVSGTVLPSAAAR
ncbi:MULTISPECIES: fumarylacetoacetase [unclassified Variovorax]|uniref:fumarylacetoacetase n=1 Tax=unclassified Variovorax TaxID=663243 RepID=UPI002575547A|nr:MULTISPECIES: fumarylacetoacetase [unclassified Variovorax]MDM0091116.1 fumarylacetoacetase [Variovorax sp. J22G40]MDM0148882.1 fumarylacetoacetase [Variovorax sp. J2P1-31]